MADFSQKDRGFEQYTDVDRVIDVFIYTYYIYALDNTSKNVLWATFDGTKWIPSVYDLDGTWGLKWNGTFAYSASDFIPNNAKDRLDIPEGSWYDNDKMGRGNLLFSRIMENYPDRI